mmetsp:Transcript_76622/g.215011  ORF Transcript_76622/g.215011 Transcript_76622/m.215011 type:complete len:237 (-) Transcript_76622:1608-2318(-)
MPAWTFCCACDIPSVAVSWACAASAWASLAASRVFSSAALKASEFCTCSASCVTYSTTLSSWSVATFWPAAARDSAFFAISAPNDFHWAVSSAPAFSRSLMLSSMLSPCSLIICFSNFRSSLLASMRRLTAMSSPRTSSRSFDSRNFSPKATMSLARDASCDARRRNAFTKVCATGMPAEPLSTFAAAPRMDRETKLECISFDTIHCTAEKMFKKKKSGVRRHTMRAVKTVAHAPQ